jgi:hypothetical protein
MIKVQRFNFDEAAGKFKLDHNFQSVTFPIAKSVLDELTPRFPADILRLYMHHADEDDGHSGPYGKMASEITADISYIKGMESGQKESIGALCIAYNFIVMEDGIVYQCRPADKIPASQIGDNLHGLSVCFDGDFTSHGLNAIQLDIGKKLFKYLAGKYHIKEILAHRDVEKMYPDNPGYYATACPGQYGYEHDLPEIRKYALG